MSQARRRILYVHNSADLYGASRSLIRLLKHLDRNRYWPMVVLPEAGPLQEIIESMGVEVRAHPRLSVVTRQNFGSWRLLYFILNYPCSVLWLWRLIRKQRIDLVHTNTGVIVSPALAARLAGAPHVWHIRDWFQEFKWIWKPYSAYIRGCSQRVLAVSNAIARQFGESDRVSVLHNGFTLEEFQGPHEKWRREFREKHELGDQFVVGCVGRIKFVRKGQEYLAQAGGLLKQKGRTARILIVGAPFPGNEQHLRQLQELIRELHLEDSVVLAGEVSDPRAAYAAMDVMVLPSAQPEPFGGVVMEAMAMGLPVIATRLGGSIDQVAEGETGFLVPPADPVAIAEKIERLIDDPALRIRMGQAASLRIEQHFSLRQMVDQIQELYRELIDARRS